MNPRGDGPRMVVSDLDGTLLGSDGRVSRRNLATLRWLGREGVVRVVATGRSLFSVRRALAPGFPADFLIFSTGVGVVDWPHRRLLRTVSLRGAEVEDAVGVLRGLGLDLMVHERAPENHRFHFTPPSAATERKNPDFLRRLERYAAYATAWRAEDPLVGDKSQILAITAGHRPETYRDVAAALPGLSVVRTTSPLDGESLWIEIFRRGVSKSVAASWIAARSKVARERTLAIGNDFNDLDLLGWSGTGAVVANAPDELKRRHPGVPSNDDDGFSVAVERWHADSARG